MARVFGFGAGSVVTLTLRPYWLWWPALGK
jgi:hypothetical protein